MGRRITVLLAVAASLLLAVPAQAAPPASDPPTGLRVTGATASAVGLAWNAAAGATGYQVLRGTPTTALAAIASVGSTTYTDTGRSPGTTYVYAVAAVRKAKVSATSATVTVTTVPPAPTGVTASAPSWDQVQVQWSASSGATAYEVRRDGLLRATVGSSTPLSYRDTGLTGSTRYSYTVRAVNTSGSSADSAAAVVTTPVPPKTWATMSLTGTPNPSVDGDLVSFRAVLSGAVGVVPTGTATLTVDGSSTTVALNPNGVAIWPTIRLTTGSRWVTAAYSGDSRHHPDSRTILHEVRSAPTAPPPLFDGYRTYQTASAAEAVVVADVNGDGRDDAVVSSRTGSDPATQFSLYVHDFVPGQAVPAVTRVPTGNEYVDSETVAAGDLDDDGFDDVAVGTRSGVKVLAGSATGLTAPVLVPTAGEVRDLVVAEVTGDSELDLVVALQRSSSSAEVQVLPGADALAFGPAELVALPHDLAPALSTGDVVGDSREEVVALWHDGLTYAVEVVADYGTADGGRGNWDTWAYRTVSTGGWGADSVDTGDVSGDGLVDVVVSVGGNKPTSGIAVFRHGDPDGLLPQETWASYDIPEPVVVTDADSDGDADIVVAHGGWNRVGVYRQSGSGRIGPEELYAVPYASHYDHRGLAVGDVTGDGRPDALLADYNHGLVVLPGR